MRNLLVSALLVALVVPDEGETHSRLFMRPTLRIVDIVEFRHLWKFEPLSSAAIMREFDRSSSGSLDADEREHIAEAVRDGEFPFTAETRLVQSGRIVPLSRPSGIRVAFVGKELAISFSVRPRSAIRAAGHLAIWIDDAKQNIVSDIREDAFKTSGDVFARCSQEVVRPSAVSSSSRNQAMATEMFFGDPRDGSRPALTSTRLEVDCPK